MDDIVTSSLKGLMEAFKIDGGALAYMVADLPAIRSLSALSDSMSTRALLSCNMPTIVYFAALLSFNISERNMLSFDFPRTDRFSQIVSRWKILWSFTTAWASSTLWNQCSTDIDENMWLHMVWRKGKISLHLDCMSQESRWTYICGIEDFRVRGDMNNNNEPFSSERKEEWNLGGAELLLAHGLPTASWAASAMRTSRFKVVGLSNRGLATLAGNSMHVASAARLSMMCCVCVCCQFQLAVGWLELWPKNSGCIGPVGSNLCMRTEGGWFFKELS